MYIEEVKIMDKQYDLVIIGSGPAGLSAAVYAKRAMLSTLVIEKQPMSGGQILNTYEVDNYLGLSMMNGFDMGMKFREHANQLGAEFKVAQVSTIVDNSNGKEVHLADGTIIEAKAIILATGAHYRKLEVPGELELTGKGVSYCATCDGAFFRGKTVAVVGGGDVALEDAQFLARGCEKVYVIHRRDEFRGAKILQSKLMELPNVEIIWDTVVTKIDGDDKVAGVQLENKKTSVASKLAVDAVFVAVGIIPDSGLLKDIVEIDDGGYIIADETGTTNKPGIYVAGDVRKKKLRQIITAAADGANAVYAIEQYFAVMP